MAGSGVTVAVGVCCTDGVGLAGSGVAGFGVLVGAGVTGIAVGTGPGGLSLFFIRKVHFSARQEIASWTRGICQSAKARTNKRDNAKRIFFFDMGRVYQIDLRRISGNLPRINGIKNPASPFLGLLRSKDFVQHILVPSPYFGHK